MFSKVFTTLSLVLALSVHVNGHALIAPALGVQGNGARSDVQRPSGNNGCGNVNVAQTIGSSTAVTAAADGTFTVTATDFNAGADGSRQVSGTVDATGTGKSFNGAVTVSKNGNPAPNSVGSDQIVASLPSGTKCTGGTSKNLCLVSFKTTAGFGNCVVVQQGAGAAGAAGAAGGNANAGANGNAANNGAANGNANAGANGNAANANANGNGNGNGRGRNGFRGGRVAGTRAARALLADLEARGEKTLDVVKRNIVGWIWA